MNAFLGPFPRAKTICKLLRNSENATNITENLHVREKVKLKTYVDLIGKFEGFDLTTRDSHFTIVVEVFRFTKHILAKPHISRIIYHIE